MPSDPDAFRNLATVMAYDSGVEAGRAAERTRVVGIIRARRAGEFSFLCSDNYELGYRDALGEVLEDLEELPATAAPRGTTREGG